MNSIKSIILLELLYKQSSANREKILNMFMDVVDGTDIYKRLENLLNSNIFIGPEASELHQHANVLLNEVRVNPKEAINIFFKLEELVLTLEKKKEESEDLLSALDFFEKKPSVVSKILAATSTKFYEEFYQALTYLTAALFGIDGVMHWSELPIGSFTDLVNFLDTIPAERVKDIKPTKGKWSIVEKHYSDGISGVSYDGCELLFEDSDEIRTIGTHKYPFIRTIGANDKKKVEGYGYIVGVALQEIDSLFKEEVIHKTNTSSVEIDTFSIDSSILYNPVEFLTGVLGTNKFILAPEDYVSLLNKYFLIRTVIERKNNSKCVLCGRSVDTMWNEICSNHFDYTQN